LLFVLGITDLGSGMFGRSLVNAATQSGAIYALVNSGTGSACASLTPGCLTGIKAAMNDAIGDASFCTDSVCTASIAACADGAPKCIIVSVSWPYVPILPDVLHSWTESLTVSSIATIRIL
jgi:hypothetical protein